MEIKILLQKNNIFRIKLLIKKFKQCFLLFLCADLTPNEKVEISVTDFVKPVPGFGNRDYDYSLWLAWFVIIFWLLAYVRTMNFWRRFVEDIKNIWREAEAQHEHAD